MEKRLPGLDLDALRSFVTGMECGSFAGSAAPVAFHLRGQRPA